MKFGALSVPDGHIEVVWRVIDASTASSTLEFTWLESGGPAIETAPCCRGFGTEQLERMLNYQLGAKADLIFEPEGLQCRIRVPLSPDFGCLRSALGRQTDT